MLAVSYRAWAGLLLIALAGCIEQPPAPVVMHGLPPSHQVETPPAQVERLPPPGEAIGRVPVPRQRPTAQAIPQPRSRPAVAGNGQPEVGGLRVVLVEPGDTVFAIARRHDVPLRSLIEANQLSPPYVLVTGQPLAVPRARHHTVQRGDTLYGISRLYGTDVFSLAQSNDIAAPYRLAVGQRLVIPHQFAAAAAVPPDVPAATLPSSGPPPAEPAITIPDAAAAVVTAPPGAAEPVSLPAPPPRAGRNFAWPARGRLLSRFGTKNGGLHNDGINIALAPGAPVRAAENGVVVYAGNELRGYGNLLLIRHADGWMTAYAHNDRLLVGRGATVRRGQLIAHAGATGSARSPQLHFEIRRGAQALDPLQHLAEEQAGQADSAVSAAAGRGGRRDPG